MSNNTQTISNLINILAPNLKGIPSKTDDKQPSIPPVKMIKQLCHDDRMQVAIYSDAFHDFDDSIAILTALKDHKKNRIRLKYIALCSGNNKKRAEQVALLCNDMKVFDVPIIACKREDAFTSNGNPLINVVNLAEYIKDNTVNEYVISEKQRQLGDVIINQFKKNNILIFNNVILTQRNIIKNSNKLNILIIGPGPDCEVFTNDLVYNIEAITWQGLYNDIDIKRGSFNMKSDINAYIKMKLFAEKNNINQYYIGKNTAYQTKLPMYIFRALAYKSKNVDLQKIVQLGVQEFRDASRVLFNSLNIPPCCAHRPIAPGFLKIQGKTWWSESNQCVRINKGVKCIGSMKSTNCCWFENCTETSPMYDITAYLLMRDRKTHIGLYKIEKLNETIFQVGKLSPDIKNKKHYMLRIKKEIEEFVECLNNKYLNRI